MTGRSRWIAVTRSSDEKPVRLARLKQNRYKNHPSTGRTLLLAGCQVGNRQWALCIQGAHYRIPGILFGTRNAHTLYCSWSLNPGIGAQEALASATPILSHCMVSIGCCYEGSLLLVQCQLISINKLESGKEQGQSKWETILWNFENSQEVKGRSEKFKNL
jgi:hypothetical protein